MKHLIILSIIFKLSLTCSVSPDYIFPSVEESYRLCESAIVGVVDNMPEEDVLEGRAIYLKNAQYFKGCGPERIKITGYSSGARCSIYPPRTGKRIIVFVCRNSEGDGFILHRYAPYAGQLIANRRHLRQLKNISGETGYCDFSEMPSSQCKSRTF